MNKERLKQIGNFLNYRIIVHRNVENDTNWTTEEKMIQELYDSYLDLLIKYKKQKEVIDKATEYIKEKQKIQYKFALSHIECDDLLQILEAKEVSE